jgi:hypothetical protein
MLILLRQVVLIPASQRCVNACAEEKALIGANQRGEVAPGVQGRVDVKRLHYAIFPLFFPIDRARASSRRRHIQLHRFLYTRSITATCIQTAFAGSMDM